MILYHSWPKRLHLVLCVHRNFSLAPQRIVSRIYATDFFPKVSFQSFTSHLKCINSPPRLFFCPAPPPSQIHKLINIWSSCELSRLLTFALQFIDFQDVTSTQIILRLLLGRKSSFASSDTHFIKVWSRQTTIQIRRNFFEPNYWVSIFYLLCAA